MAFQSPRGRLLATLVGSGLALILLVGAGEPQALRTASSDVFLIREGEVVDENLYVAGSLVRIAGTIRGDLMVLATDHLEVSGRVEGDVIGFAATANLTGAVTGSVRLVGIDLDIAARTGGDVVGLGRDVYLGGSTSGDSLVWSNSLIAGGEVGRDLTGRTFGRATVGGRVGRDVEMTVGRLVVLEGAHVVEDLGYRSAREAVIDSGAVIGGVLAQRVPLTADLRTRAARLMLGFIAFVLLVAYGLVMIGVTPDKLERSVTRLERHPLRCLRRGSIQVGILVLPIAAATAGVIWGSPKVVITSGLLGLFMVPLVVVGLTFLVLTAPLPVLILVGRVISRNRLSDYAAFILPVIPLAVLLSWFPYVGLGVGVVLLVMGGGARSLTAGERYVLSRL